MGDGGGDGGSSQLTLDGVEDLVSHRVSITEDGRMSVDDGVGGE